MQLNWDRTKHYFVFNGALIAAAGAVFKLGDSKPVSATVACLLVVAGLNGWAGVAAIRKGHEYYESDRKRVASIEKLLGLDQPQGSAGAILAMMKTAGMRGEHGQKDLKRGRLSTITGQAIGLQQTISVLAFAGAVAALAHLAGMF